MRGVLLNALCPGHPRGSACTWPERLADPAPIVYETAARMEDVDGRDKPYSSGAGNLARNRFSNPSTQLRQNAEHGRCSIVGWPRGPERGLRRAMPGHDGKRHGNQRLSSLFLVRSDPRNVASSAALPLGRRSRAEALRTGCAPRLRHDFGGGGARARSRFRFGSGGPHGSCRDFASASGSGNRLRRRRRLLPVWGAERGCARRSGRRGRGDADRALRARPRRRRLQHRLDAGPRAAARRSSPRGLRRHGPGDQAGGVGVPVGPRLGAGDAGDGRARLYPRARPRFRERLRSDAGGFCAPGRSRGAATARRSGRRGRNRRARSRRASCREEIGAPIRSCSPVPTFRC